ncbi:hypothetical protein [Paenibacillus thalictri]|uniref:Uncharacterized protein n=1 Tax=Paenibacillus thalictri TaxID=2527873 RepID=A0A4Q9DZD0_9BACL|nr:hypothetical protein [Paenibacillus thalictri]TBL81845.1 hypothetical protein EYB31_02325 [Paenibacillus thalictri]
MMKRMLAAVPAAALMLLSLSLPAGAAAAKVQVTLPPFEVSLNSYAPIAQFEPYPPIVYKGVTYVPMTWNNSIRLNVAIDWSEGRGFSIQRKEQPESQSFAQPYEPPASENNELNKPYEAEVAAYRITVNSKPIDNSSEPYPVLSFRNITYFPLTWRFAQEEFGWATAWSAEDGFGLVAGDRKHVIGGIYGDDGQSLFFGTNIYGTFKIDKSLRGAPESLRAQGTEGNLPQTENRKAVKRVETDPAVQRNQTKLAGDTVSWNGKELVSLQSALEQAKTWGSGYAYEQEGVRTEDYVLPLGKSNLISLYTNVPSASDATFLVSGGQVTKLDNIPPYRWVDNGDGTFWVSSADAFHEPHHISWSEHRLWLIDKEGAPHSINEKLGAEVVSMLAVMGDGTLVVLAGGALTDDVEKQVYRLKSDGSADKWRAPAKGLFYADGQGEVYVVSGEDNRISKLSDGSSVALTEKELFLASRKMPQQ